MSIAVNSINLAIVSYGFTFLELKYALISIDYNLLSPRHLSNLQLAWLCFSSWSKISRLLSVNELPPLALHTVCSVVADAIITVAFLLYMFRARLSLFWTFHSILVLRSLKLWLRTFDLLGDVAWMREDSRYSRIIQLASKLANKSSFLQYTFNKRHVSLVILTLLEARVKRSFAYSGYLRLSFAHWQLLAGCQVGDGNRSLHTIIISLSF